jgi:hypothetical protein
LATPLNPNLFREVILQLPAGLFGGDPRGLLQYLGLHGRRVDDNRWSVRPNDDGSFVRCRDLADETEFVNFNPLRNARDPGVTFDDPDTLARFSELEEQLAERMATSSDLAASFHLIQANLATAATADELLSVVRGAYENLRAITIEVTGELAFPQPGVTLLTATDLLIRRARLPAILFRFDQDPDVMANMSSIDELPQEGFFASSAHWYREVIGLIHYLGPLLGCLSPRFWCLPTGRPPFAVLFSLGMDLSGLRNSPMELMQLLPGAGRMEPTPPVDVTPAACRHAIHWWAFRLNQMFQYLGDPTTFGNADGVYDPWEHQHWLLTFGQIFGLTTALQTAGRNYSVQRVLMNTLLDTYADRIKTRSRFDQLCTYRTAMTIADKVRARMTDEVAGVLMPVADRAVESLRGVEDGFFIRRQRGDTNVVVRIPGDPGLHREPHHATAILLKVFRNATHGFGGKTPDPADEKAMVAERMLAHHTGDMPADLVFLPYLYLLDTLSRPDEVRETIIKRASRRQSTYLGG